MGKIVGTPYGREVDVPEDCRRLDLKHVSFAGLELRGYDFRGADLRNADFTGALLINCRFDDADTDIRAADFSDARILNTGFDGAQAQRSVWCGATAARCHFDGADLTDADFGMGPTGHRSNLFAAIFKGAILVRTRFIGANLRSVVADSDTVIEDIETAGADVFECDLIQTAPLRHVS